MVHKPAIRSWKTDTLTLMWAQKNYQRSKGPQGPLILCVRACPLLNNSDHML